MKNWLLAFCCCISQITFAQQWYGVDSGLHGKYEGLNVEASAILVDTIHNFLYAVGTFDSAGSIKSSNFSFWDGIQWHSGGVNGGFFIPLKSLAMYHDTILLGGPQGLALWYDTSWISKILPIQSGVSNPTCFTYFHDTLWAGGAFGVKYFNGEKWVKPPGVFSTLLGYIEINALTVYNNELIVGGFFYGIGDTICHNIAAWDGKVWHSMSSGIKISTNEETTSINCLATYKGKLYAGGYFNNAGGLTCLQLATWNGEKWDSINGNSHNFCGGPPYCLLQHDSNLYIGGYMINTGDDCQTDRIARWDGNTIHDLHFVAAGSGVVYSLAWFDGELYAAGSFNYVNGSYSIQSIARSVIATGITSTTKENSFEIFPNPATDELHVSFPFSNNIIIISDLFGREVRQWKIESGEWTMINISSLQAGVYIVSVRDEKGSVMASEKLFKE